MFLYVGYTEKKHAYSVDGFCGHRSAVFEAMGCYYQCCPYPQEARLSLTEGEIQRRNLEKRVGRTTKAMHTSKKL